MTAIRRPAEYILADPAAAQSKVGERVCVRSRALRQSFHLFDFTITSYINI